MSFVASCRINGTTRFFIERFSTTFDEAEVVVDPDRRIPAFPSEEQARAEVARRFPLPRGAPVSERSSVEELAAAMEDEYSQKMKLFYDLDAARDWCRAPGPSGIGPGDALQVWELLWQVGEAPRPQRLDPMYLVAMHENILRDPAHRADYELVLLGMKLSGIVILAQETGQPPDWGMEFPEMAEMWPATDYPRLASILEKGIAALAGRMA